LSTGSHVDLSLKMQSSLKIVQSEVKGYKIQVKIRNYCDEIVKLRPRHFKCTCMQDIQNSLFVNKLIMCRFQFFTCVLLYSIRSWTEFVSSISKNNLKCFFIFWKHFSRIRTSIVFHCVKSS